MAQLPTVMAGRLVEGVATITQLVELTYTLAIFLTTTTVIAEIVATLREPQLQAIKEGDIPRALNINTTTTLLPLRMMEQVR